MQEHERLAAFFKALAHPLRLRIVRLLGDKEISVQCIVDSVGTTQSNISTHLAVLHNKGVLRTRRKANRVYYRVADARTLSVVEQSLDVFGANRHERICANG